MLTFASSKVGTEGKPVEQYEGDWVEGKMHGHGIFINQNSAVFDVLQKKFVGNVFLFCEKTFFGLVQHQTTISGKYQYSDNGVYQGDWVQLQG